jgi:hypothetical protein
MQQKSTQPTIVKAWMTLHIMNHKSNQIVVNLWEVKCKQVNNDEQSLQNQMQISFSIV